MSSRVNEANGENLQDPPIKNSGYANDKLGLWPKIKAIVLLEHDVGL